MAIRPVFKSLDQKPFFQRKMIEFQYCSGFSEAQKKRSVNNLHQAWKKYDIDSKVLEVSRASEKGLGYNLSAFNLSLKLSNGIECSVECAFQGGKCFEKGGPFIDLLQKDSRTAKKDVRLRESGKLVAFSLLGELFSLNPPTFFYDWLYINALYQHSEYHEELLKYDSFTDIMFNPEKQINCQAEAVAMFVGLYRNGKLEQALKDRETFLENIFVE